MSKQEREENLPLIPAITDQSGRYVHMTEGGSEWSYTYDIHAAGTKSERRIGQLQADGLERELAAAKPDDTIQTPWGLMVRASDTRYEHGFLLEHTHGQAIDPSQGKLLPVPESQLTRGGRWSAQVGPWRYTVVGMAMKSRSERRIGRLYFGRTELLGNKQGDYVDTPWGRVRWMGPVSLDATFDYEQGFLLRGTYDHSLDNLEGDAIFPPSPGISVRLDSLYLDSGFRVAVDAQPAHSVSLLLSGRPDREVEMTGVLLLDPNQCGLNDFGDREGCTRMAVRRIEVRVVRQRLGDPRHLKRRYFEVTADELPQALALIVQEKNPERTYLKLERQLVPLYADGV